MFTNSHKIVLSVNIKDKLCAPGSFSSQHG